MQLWAHAYRQKFHNRVDTNNITESFNNVLRKRYLPLRHDTTIFALVQVLVEVVFPEQETRYIQAIVKLTKQYRVPRYSLPMWLQGRPHSIQGICLLNIERGKAISKSQITETETNGNFCLQASAKAAGDTEDGKWIVSIPNGHCSCPSFVSSHVPCKHMFAVIHHYPTWTWESLPLELTNSPHMVLDASAIDSVLHTEPPESTSFSTDNATSSSAEFIPTTTSHGRQLHSMQKKMEDVLGRCRSLAFLTSDVHALESAYEQCIAVLDALTSAATSTTDAVIPPVFHEIAKAGVAEFKSTTKTLCRAKSKGRNKQSDQQCPPKHSKQDDNNSSNQLEHA